MHAKSQQKEQRLQELSDQHRNGEPRKSEEANQRSDAERHRCRADQTAENRTCCVTCAVAEAGHHTGDPLNRKAEEEKAEACSQECANRACRIDSQHELHGICGEERTEKPDGSEHPECRTERGA